MKFTDGYWLVRKGFSLHYPAEVRDARAHDGYLEIFAPVKKVRHRGDTLNAPLLSLSIEAPAENVLKVRISHWQGVEAPKPSFELSEPTPGIARISIDEEKAEIRSGGLVARFNRGDGPWELEFLGDDRLLTSSGVKAQAYAQGPDGTAYVKEELSLDVGEYVYGLGERFTSFVKNGQGVEIWNRDGGTSSEQAYKNVPFYLSNRGYGVFVNHPELVSFEVGSEKVNRVQFSVPGEYLEYYIFYGPSPKEVLGRYTALSGRPALPPAWSFGLWLSTSFTTSYDEETVTGFIKGMEDRSLPLSVFHFDCFWMREFHWSDFIWDPETFPDPRGMLQRLKSRGLKICVWINPYIAQRSVLFEEGKAGGFLVKKPNGEVWQSDMWQAGMGLVDFSNPGARAWYTAKLGSLLDMGVDAFKTDFGERIPIDVTWADGSDPMRMHNFYSYLYNRTVFEYLEERLGKGNAAVFARSATAGGQKFPVHWGGDNESTFASMAESLRGGLSLGLSGFGFWSHDIGGFEGTPPQALFQRWIAFGLLSSHSRLHGSTSVRVPWVYGETAVDVLRFFTELKISLMPYIYAQAVATTRTGVPILRAAVLEFPDDPTAQTLDRQFFLGDSLLVAPVFSENGHVDVYIPEGTWTHVISGERVEGPRWRQEVHDPMSLPLYARPGTLLAFTSERKRPDADWTRTLSLKLYALADGATAAAGIVDTAGSDIGVVRVSRKGGEYRVEAPASILPFSLEIDGKTQVVDAVSRTIRI